MKEKIQEILDKAKNSDLPEGSMFQSNTKKWFETKLSFILSSFSDEEIEEEGLVSEWEEALKNALRNPPEEVELPEWIKLLG